MRMSCEVSIDSKKIKKYTGKEMTQEEFAAFCSDAIIRKLWEFQITDKETLAKNK